MRGDPRCPDGESKWELWYHDLFDRDSVSKGAEGTGILEGLALLWRKEAVEGIFDDGSPTFSTFSIKWGNHSVAETADVYRDPLMNPGLRNIRLWRSEELFDEVATAHLRVLEKSKRWEKRSINFRRGVEDDPRGRSGERGRGGVQEGAEEALKVLS